MEPVERGHGYEQKYVRKSGPVGTFLSGLIWSTQRWRSLGITVYRYYDPKSSPPRLRQRIVEYD